MSIADGGLVWDHIFSLSNRLPGDGHERSQEVIERDQTWDTLLFEVTCPCMVVGPEFHTAVYVVWKVTLQWSTADVTFLGLCLRYRLWVIIPVYWCKIPIYRFVGIF